jgi:hypothetical protein
MNPRVKVSSILSDEKFVLAGIKRLQGEEVM